MMMNMPPQMTFLNSLFIKKISFAVCSYSRFNGMDSAWVFKEVSIPLFTHVSYQDSLLQDSVQLGFFFSPRDLFLRDMNSCAERSGFLFYMGFKNMRTLCCS